MTLFAAASAAALALLAAPAFAQHQHHELPPKSAPEASKPPAHEPSPSDATSELGSRTDEGVMDSRHAGHVGANGALGRYPMTRESSGTAWQPDTSEHMGLTVQSGDWSLMGHGVLNLVYDHQSGRRGDDKLFVSGMLMGLARRP